MLHCDVSGRSLQFQCVVRIGGKAGTKFSNIGKSSRQMFVFFVFFCGFLGNMTSFVCCLREREREKSAAGEGMIVYIKSASPSVLIHHK